MLLTFDYFSNNLVKIPKFCSITFFQSGILLLFHTPLELKENALWLLGKYFLHVKKNKVILPSQNMIAICVELYSVHVDL